MRDAANAGPASRGSERPPRSTLPSRPSAGTYKGAGNTNLVINKKITLQAAAGPEGTTIDCGGADGCRAFNLTGDAGQSATIQGE